MKDFPGDHVATLGGFWVFVLGIPWLLWAWICVFGGGLKMLWDLVQCVHFRIAGGLSSLTFLFPRYYRQHDCFPPPVKGKPGAVSPAANPPATDHAVQALHDRLHHVGEIAAIKLQAAEDRTDAAVARANAAERRDVAAEARAEAEKKERVEREARWEKRWEDERESGGREATRWRRMYEQERARAYAQKENKPRRTSQ